MNKCKPCFFSRLIPFITLLFLFSIPLLPAESSLKIYVKDKKSNTPLDRVKITLIFHKNPSVRYRLESDAKGYLYKKDLKKGLYRINFEKEGYLPQQTSSRLINGESLELDILMDSYETESIRPALRSISQAKQLMAKGKYESAIAKITDALSKNPDTFILYYHRAVAYEKAGDSDKALQDYEKSAALKPDFLLALSSTGDIYARRGEFQPAASYYRKVFEQGCHNALILYNYASCLINRGEKQQAKEVFKKVIQLDPLFADAYYQLGILLLGMDDHEKAETFLKKFIRLDPENNNVPIAQKILSTLN